MQSAHKDKQNRLKIIVLQEALALRPPGSDHLKGFRGSHRSSFAPNISRDKRLQKSLQDLLAVDLGSKKVPDLRKDMKSVDPKTKSRDYLILSASVSKANPWGRCSSMPCPLEQV